jgi:hypothetical protein
MNLRVGGLSVCFCCQRLDRKLSHILYLPPCLAGKPNHVLLVTITEARKSKHRDSSVFQDCFSVTLADIPSAKPSQSWSRHSKDIKAMLIA